MTASPFSVVTGTSTGSICPDVTRASGDSNPENPQPRPPAAASRLRGCDPSFAVLGGDGFSAALVIQGGPMPCTASSCSTGRRQGSISSHRGLPRGVQRDWIRCGPKIRKSYSEMREADPVSMWGLATVRWTGWLGRIGGRLRREAGLRSGPSSWYPGGLPARRRPAPPMGNPAR